MKTLKFSVKYLLEKKKLTIIYSLKRVHLLVERVKVNHIHNNFSNTLFFDKKNIIIIIKLSGNPYQINYIRLIFLYFYFVSFYHLCLFQLFHYDCGHLRI